MYFRPGNLIKDFVVEPVSRVKNSKGRAQTTYDPCTHQIVQRGGEAAKPGDRLVRGRAHYYILGVDNVAAMGIATIYYAEERLDLDDGSEL